MVIIDEKTARIVAKTYGIGTANGILFLLFRLLALRKINAAEGEKTLDELVMSGLYIDPITFLRPKRKLNEFVALHD